MAERVSSTELGEKGAALYRTLTAAERAALASMAEIIRDRNMGYGRKRRRLS